jgi:hypothetical protein
VDGSLLLPDNIGRNLAMAIERNPNTPYEPDRLNNPVSPDPYTAEIRSRPPFEQDLQVDPEPAEGPASNAKIGLFALGIAIVLGAVFYGLNNSSVHQQNAATPASSTAQNSTSPPAAPPGMRDVTPRAPNSEPGKTTGAAPANPQAPSPASTNPGGAK